MGPLGVGCFTDRFPRARDCSSLPGSLPPRRGSALPPFRALSGRAATAAPFSELTLTPNTPGVTAVE